MPSTEDDPRSEQSARELLFVTNVMKFERLGRTCSSKPHMDGKLKEMIVRSKAIFRKTMKIEFSMP